MTERDVREGCRVGLLQALEGCSPAVIEEVLARAAEVPYEGDLDAFKRAVADMARTVIQRRIDETSHREEELLFEAAVLKVLTPDLLT